MGGGAGGRVAALRPRSWPPMVMVPPPTTAPSRVPLHGPGPSPLLRTPCLHPGPLALGPSYLSISMQAHRFPFHCLRRDGYLPSPQQSQDTRGSPGAERWTEPLRLLESGQVLLPTAQGCPCMLRKRGWGGRPPAWSDKPLTTPLGPKRTVLPRQGRAGPHRDFRPQVSPREPGSKHQRPGQETGPKSESPGQALVALTAATWGGSGAAGWDMTRPWAVPEAKPQPGGWQGRAEGCGTHGLPARFRAGLVLHARQVWARVGAVSAGLVHLQAASASPACVHVCTPVLFTVALTHRRYTAAAAAGI